MSKIYDYAIQQPIVTSDFGWRDCPYHGREHHDGVDLISGTGNRNLFAIEDGYVHIVQNSNSGYGNRIWIRYPRINKSVMYAHCEKIYAKKGDNVKQGDIVAYEGKTGNATGVHLHFGMTDIGSDTWLNPQTYDYQPPNAVVNPVERDTTKDQLKVLTTNLRVRKEPSTDSAILGFVQTNGIYNYYDVKDNQGYKWYKIENEQWIANNEEWLEIYPKEEDEKVIEELKKELAEEQAKNKVLEEKNEILNTLNQALQEENNKLVDDLDKFRNVYTCEETGTYKFRIKLYKDESLYIK